MHAGDGGAQLRKFTGRQRGIRRPFGPRRSDARRLTFRLDESDALIDLDLEDYHGA